MKIHFLYLLLFFSMASVAQSSAYFKGIKFDSNYAFIGCSPHWVKNGDSLERFSFIIDNTEDLTALQKRWVFKKRINNMNINQMDGNGFLVCLTQYKLLINHNDGVINPFHGSIKTPDGWYHLIRQNS